MMSAGSPTSRAHFTAMSRSSGLFARRFSVISDRQASGPRLSNSLETRSRVCSTTRGSQLIPRQYRNAPACSSDVLRSPGVEPEGVLALLLCCVHGGVRALHQAVLVGRVGGIHGSADARRPLTRLAGDLHR